MSSPTGQEVRFDPKTQTHYALDARTGRWVPVGPPNPSNQPRTTPLPSGRLPVTPAGIAPRSPPSAMSSSYTTATPDATGTAAQLQGLNIGPRAGPSNQSVTAAGAPLPTRATLDPGYKVRDQPKRYFKFGKVFKALWTEPEGQSKRGQSSRFSRNQDVYRVAFGQTVYSKVRRFIVLREGDQSCICLAISTHSGLGATQRSPFEHGIVFTGAQPPPPMSPSENQMQPIPVRIDVDQRSDALDRASRVHYGKLYTIEHNFKVKPFGMVNPGSVQAFSNQFNTVWTRMSSQTPLPTPLPTIQQGQPLSHPVGSPSGSNTQGLPSSETLRRSGFSDLQIKAMRILVNGGKPPRYALARVRAEASKATPTQAHEVGRLVVGGMEFAAAYAQVVQSGTDDAQAGGADDDDDDDDEDDDEDEDDEEEEEEEEEESSEEESETPRRRPK